MPTTGVEHLHPAAAGDWPALEGVIKRFEEAWRRGLHPVIEDYLPDDEELRRALLIELVHTELELRLKLKEPARVEEYLARYPELAGKSAPAKPRLHPTSKKSGRYPASAAAACQFLVIFLRKRTTSTRRTAHSPTREPRAVP